jgi:flagellar biosynthesis protein FlhA
MAQPQQGGSLPIPEIIISIFVLSLICILVFELPPVMVDFFISINMSIGVVLLMMSLYVQKPLDMAAFPSVILVGTLFRLCLGIASTRLILARGEAGEIIKAFGEFVTGGNLVVGAVIFIIITIVQFLVITKGSERIAEVGARFALDAMPGKQMTIDADFNSGLISPDEAIRRREELTKESNLYGSMDGAMKFVKGDAIAGIIITCINIIGGIAIGILMVKLPIGAALDKYTKLTIGDGLSQQLPALLMAVSCGLMMTRSTAMGKSLGQDLSAQAMSKPQALIFATIFLVGVAIVGGITGALPWWAFLIIASFIGFVAFTVFITHDVQSQLHQLDAVKHNMQQLIDPNRMYEHMGVDILSLQVGSDLLRIADPEQEGQLLAKIAALRQRMTDQLGFIMPNIRIMDSSALGPNEYLIAIRENSVAIGSVYPDRVAVSADQWESSGRPVPNDVIHGRDPIYQSEVYWIRPEQVDEETMAPGDPTDVVVNHLAEVVRKYVDEIMTKTDVLKLMELVKSQDPTLVNDLVPAIISTSDLRKIFVNLIREKVSIKDILFVFERLCDFARFSKEPDILSERLRAALGRQICLTNSDENKVLHAVTLSQDWEKTLDESCQRTELGTMFLLNPIQVQELIETTAQTLVGVQQNIGKLPVILCSPRIRLPLYQLLERHIPAVAVISYSELIPDIQVEQVGTIGAINYDNYAYN